MKILIATGIYPPDIGGPAYYAKALNDEFTKLGHSVSVLSYGAEKKLPIGLRHFVYFLKTVLSLREVDFIIALDTFSVGLPALLAAKLFRKKIIVRTGGDFLWESYVARTGEKILLSEFYKKDIHYSFKEKIIFKVTKFLLRNIDAIVFSTQWQQDIFAGPYDLPSEKMFIVENFYGKKKESIQPKKKNFLWAGRNIPLKNIDTLKAAFEGIRKKDQSILLDISEQVSHDDLLEKIQNCYAIILPSISEVSPNFILEAAAYGKPFIMTKDTGLYDVFENVGLFVNPLNAEDIKEKILFLSDDYNYKEYVEKVSAFDKVHSCNEIAQELVGVYKNL